LILSGNIGNPSPLAEEFMAQVCELTGKRPAYGNKVSHSNIKTRTRWMPNLRYKIYEIPEMKRSLNLMLSTRAIRTIDKLGGITPALMKAADSVLSDRLRTIKSRIHRSRVKATAAGKVAAASGAPAKKVKAPRAAAPAKKSSVAKAKKK
jgi:large subunit ribosomal protein L28